MKAFEGLRKIINLISFIKEFNDRAFVSGIKKDNIRGCQFHPEKSHEVGVIFYKNFINE